MKIVIHCERCRNSLPGSDVLNVGRGSMSSPSHDVATAGRVDRARVSDFEKRSTPRGAGCLRVVHSISADASCRALPDSIIVAPAAPFNPFPIPAGPSAWALRGRGAGAGHL